MMPGHFVKPASRRSGVPTPTRLTFTPAIQAVVHCPCAALPPSGLRLLSEPAHGHGHPRAHQTYRRREARSGSDWTRSTFGDATQPHTLTATRRQDVANKHQRKHANLGFACFRPKESRTGGPSFP